MLIIGIESKQLAAHEKSRLLAPEVSGAILFALSPLARFVTGQLLAVNGGFVMH